TGCPAKALGNLMSRRLFLPAPLMGAGWGGGDAFGCAAREVSSRLDHRDFAGRRGCRIAPQPPHPNPPPLKRGGGDKRIWSAGFSLALGMEVTRALNCQ